MSIQKTKNTFLEKLTIHLKEEGIDYASYSFYFELSQKRRVLRARRHRGTIELVINLNSILFNLEDDNEYKTILKFVEILLRLMNNSSTRLPETYLELLIFLEINNMCYSDSYVDINVPSSNSIKRLSPLTAYCIINTIDSVITSENSIIKHDLKSFCNYNLLKKYLQYPEVIYFRNDSPKIALLYLLNKNEMKLDALLEKSPIVRHLFYDNYKNDTLYDWINKIYIEKNDVVLNIIIRFVSYYHLDLELVADSVSENAAEQFAYESNRAIAYFKEDNSDIGLLEDNNYQIVKLFNLANIVLLSERKIKSGIIHELW